MWWLLLGGMVARAADDRAVAEALLAADPTSADRWVALAATADDPREAVALVREALRIDPAHVDALLALAATLDAAGDAEGAGVALERATTAAPDDRRVRLTAAKHDPSLARAVLAAFPGDPDAALLVARLAPEDAAAAFASVTVPDRRVLTARITADLRSGDLADADLAFTSFRTSFPEGDDLPRLERWASCLRAGTVDPATVSTLLDLRSRGMIDPTGASSAVDDRFARAAACPAALALRATLRADAEGAVRDLSTAVGLAPGDAALAEDLGLALLAVDRPAEARPWLASAHAARPWVAPLALADTLHRLGDDPGARDVLADPRFADDPRVILQRADLAPNRQAALALLVDAARRTRHPRVVQRARTLADDLEQAVDLAEPGVSLPPIGDDVAEEIVVVARKASEVRLEALIAHLRELGYGRPVTRGNGDVYFEAVDVQHPWVALHPDGQFDVQRSGYVPLKNAIRADEILGQGVVTVDAPIISERKLAQQRARVMDEMIGDVRSWREALCAEGFEERLLLEIPQTLDRVWRDGLPITGDAPLPTPSDRRAALLDWWATRTCTTEGEQVRTLIVRYLDHEVQPSAWPVTTGELVAANSRRACPGALVLAGLSP